MRQLDQTISQDTEGDRNDNQYTEIGERYDKNSRRNQYDCYRDRGNNLESQYQQLNHEHYQHIRNIREPTIFNPKQHRRSDISNSKDAS